MTRFTAKGLIERGYYAWVPPSVTDAKTSPQPSGHSPQILSLLTQLSQFVKSSSPMPPELLSQLALLLQTSQHVPPEIAALNQATPHSAQGYNPSDLSTNQSINQQTNPTASASASHSSPLTQVSQADPLNLSMPQHFQQSQSMSPHPQTSASASQPDGVPHSDAHKHVKDLGHYKCMRCAEPTVTTYSHHSISHSGTGPLTHHYMSFHPVEAIQMICQFHPEVSIEQALMGSAATGSRMI